MIWKNRSLADVVITEEHSELAGYYLHFLKYWKTPKRFMKEQGGNVLQ